MTMAGVTAVFRSMPVGFVLGLIGRGSIVATPMLLYLGHLAAQKNGLNRVFAALIFVVAAHIIWRPAGQA